MTTLETPIRYLSRTTVEALLPPLQERLRLVHTAYRAIRGKACQAPSPPEISPRPGAVARAMSAYVVDGDITAVKWVADFQSNTELGLPLVSGLIIVADSETGLPIALMDASAITVARTAAASAACVIALAPDDWSRIGIVGYGAQAAAHIELLSELNPDARFQVFSRRRIDSGDDRVAFVAGPAEAADGADVLVTGRPLGTRLNPPVAAEWLSPRALVLPLDEDVSVSADVVVGSDLFLVDDLEDFESKRRDGAFAGWRDPDATVPEAITDGRAGEGLIVCSNQGIGILDAVFARQVLAAAESSGSGTLLER